MNKTIKQLADELGVSKTAVRNYMDADFRAKYTAKNNKDVITITPDGCKVIAESITKSVETNRNTFAESENITIPRSVLETLQEQLRQKDDQLKAKDEQINALTESVKAQAQSINAARHNELAGTIQQSLPGTKERSGWWPFRKKGELK